MFGDKFKDNNLGITRVGNSDLVCADCKYRHDDRKVARNTAICDKYKTKPLDVIFGGKCAYYDKGA